MNTTKPALRSLALDQTAKIVEQHAKEQGIKTLVTTGDAAPEVVAPPKVEQALQAEQPQPRRRGKGSATPAQTQSPVRRMAVDLPVYLISAIRKRAAEEDTTIRYVITRALRKDGFPVESRDLIEDGRREH
jgi:hypothetical protein